MVGSFPLCGSSAFIEQPLCRFNLNRDRRESSASLLPWNRWSKKKKDPHRTDFPIQVSNHFQNPNSIVCQSQRPSDRDQSCAPIVSLLGGVRNGPIGVRSRRGRRVRNPQFNPAIQLLSNPNHSLTDPIPRSSQIKSSANFFSKIIVNQKNQVVQLPKTILKNPVRIPFCEIMGASKSISDGHRVNKYKIKRENQLIVM